MGRQHLRGDIDGLSRGDVAIRKLEDQTRFATSKKEEDRRKTIVEDKGETETLYLSINLRKIKKRKRWKKNGRYIERWKHQRITDCYFRESLLTM